ncbi:LacI family DNA-binding transcriptional regulator [Alkalimonas delamerensis]|uniref:LacI family DNA-binding transcriptional regulator n=1 Tax=Alkalimonas delamerensis TaxID=265981 RepID=A0ABT9GM26_9GAMM|nr:LacI family DNA-binding transcriptional regulator [Alkalimonas delamerensis]MDP4527741.1 LacI family DNA-binding transcriptional regulator [Alkalimonas delamerensis]
MPTIYEVSKLAGVSLATVSRVMNNTSPVRESTRKKVEAAMAELGYRPNSIARSLASNRSDSIGILVSELHGPFYGAMISSIEAEFRTAGKHVIIAAGHSEEATERDGIEFLLSRNCDALILHVEAVSDEYLVQLKAKEIPFVLINRQVPQLQPQCISLNNKLGGYLATQLLLRQGHRQLGYISGPLWKTDAQDRYRGHQLALQEAGLDWDPKRLFEGDYHEDGGSAGIRYFLQQGIPLTALICANDEMASGAMTEAREQGLFIPQQLSIIGFDNVMLSHYTYPKLSTIDYPIAAMGQMAARWVLKEVYQQKQPELQLVFEPRLIERDSCVVLPQP